MRRTANYFETGKVYLVEHRLNRYFFEVVSRTAMTLTVKLRGYQEDYSQFRPTPMLEPNDDQLQKIRLRINKDTGSEYGYVTVKFDLWGHPEQTKVAIDGKDDVSPLIQGEDNSQISMRRSLSNDRRIRRIYHRNQQN